MTFWLALLCAYLWISAGLTLGHRFRADTDSTLWDAFWLAALWPVLVPIAFFHNTLEG